MALNKAQRRISNLPHDVYKAYSAEGRLLYVGLSVNVFKRLSEHKKYAAWLPLTDCIKVDRFRNRSAARAEEARCIRDYAPVYNVTREKAWGCVPSTDVIESFTMSRDGTDWYIDGEG